MEDIENKKIFLTKLLKFRSLVLKIFGIILLVTSITGIQSYDRYVPTWLYISLGISLAVLLILYIITYRLKGNIESEKM
ncbi:hypothetical protein NSA24_11305 [Clostridioides mangenotii]|uniref:hypothetical protein n=1 Tax=Metaclostridioides mangenotii TaxID=1540 RepID=UPI001C103B30|nr:hypothetical protein [Clostridioides mangenotii]MBU5307172.1 hypothetical protein [Clostridioides mangenotii]MCR1955380.1 hypothetical protein [Clostridioides mangenotii]